MTLAHTSHSDTTVRLPRLRCETPAESAAAQESVDLPGRGKWPPLSGNCSVSGGVVSQPLTILNEKLVDQSGYRRRRAGPLQIVSGVESDDAGVADSRRKEPAVRRRDCPVHVTADDQRGGTDASENGDAGPGRNGSDLPEHAQRVRSRPPCVAARCQQDAADIAGAARNRPEPTRGGQQHQSVHAGGMADGELLGDCAAMGEPDDIRFVDADGIQNPGSDIRQHRHRVRQAGSLARADPGTVEGDDGSASGARRRIGVQLSIGRDMPLSSNTGSPDPVSAPDDANAADRKRECGRVDGRRRVGHGVART